MKQIIALLGPTGLNKSEVSVMIADKINAEIISCDSMQIYKNMTIGTGVIELKTRNNIPHHLINIFDIDQQYNAHMFVEMAQKTIKQIHKKNKNVIIVGGTGLYARLLIYNDPMLPSDKKISQKLIEREKSDGIEKLKEELKSLSPTRYQAIDLKNNRRVIRALEIALIEKEQKILTWNQNTIQQTKEFILTSSSAYNKDLIIKRCKKMIQNGWITEAEKAIENGLMKSPTAKQAIGYNLIDQYLNKKISSKEELIEKIISATNKYARKQRKWFKNQHPKAIYINRENMSNHQIANYIISKI